MKINLSFADVAGLYSGFVYFRDNSVVFKTMPEEIYKGMLSVVEDVAGLCDIKNKEKVTQLNIETSAFNAYMFLALMVACCSFEHSDAPTEGLVKLISSHGFYINKFVKDQPVYATNAVRVFEAMKMGTAKFVDALQKIPEPFCEANFNLN